LALSYKAGNRIVSDLNSREAFVNGNPDLRHHYKFRGESGDYPDSTILDSAGFIDGIVTGTKAFGTVAGLIPSFDFNGSSYITLDDEPFDFEHTDAFSVSFWIKITATGTYYILAKQNQGSGNNGWAILFYNSGASGLLRMELADAAQGGTTHRLSTTAGTITDNSTWKYYTMTYDGSSNISGMKIYVDGALQVTGSDDAISNTIKNLSHDLVIGASSNGNLDFEGELGDLQIWYRVLTADEISLLYNSGAETYQTVTENKPVADGTNENGTTYTEKDTGKEYILNYGAWIEK